VQQSLQSLPDPMVSPRFMGHRGEQPWSLRRIHVAQQIRNERPAIIGFQEALERQVLDLQELMGDEWAWVGVGRDDGQKAGEYGPIFYDTTQFELLGSDTFWLSPTPFKPSRFPRAGSHRMALVAHFSRKESVVSEHQKFTLINTHLDERSELQRCLGASLMLQRARYEAVTREEPIFLLGDFNSEQSGNDSGAYRIITGQSPPVALPVDFSEKYAIKDDELPNFVMIDTRDATPRFSVSGYFRTFTGFVAPLGQGEFGRIDYVLGGNNGGWKSLQYKTESIVADDGILASDHRPVYVDVELTPEA